MAIEAVASIPLIAHLKKKGFKQNERAAINFIEDLSFNVSAMTRNRKTLITENIPLKSLTENSGLSVIIEMNAPIKTHIGDVDP